MHIVHRGKVKRISEQERHQLRRRQAIEPIIGHLKADHRMDRCHLKGELGDRLHAVLCAAGFNIKWLLRMIVRKGWPSCGGSICACARSRAYRRTGLGCWANRLFTHSVGQPLVWPWRQSE